MVDLDGALVFARQLARECGAMAVTHYTDTLEFDTKSDTSPVTVADIAINKHVIDKCRERYPGIGIIGEEASAHQDSEYKWVCDPIDGTIPFLMGMKCSSFSLALLKDGEPVVGVIYDFFNDRLHSARKGQGAYLNDEPLVQSDTPLRLVEIEAGYWAKYDVEAIRSALTEHKWQTPNFASSAFVSMAVATGKIAGMVYAGDKPWDIAANKVIAEEMGCVVVDIFGNSQTYDGAIRGGVVLHPAYADELLPLIAKGAADANPRD